jgi:hypothetical protein
MLLDFTIQKHVFPRILGFLLRGLALGVTLLSGGDSVLDGRNGTLLALYVQELQFDLGTNAIRCPSLCHTRA